MEIIGGYSIYIDSLSAYTDVAWFSSELAYLGFENC